MAETQDNNATREAEIPPDIAEAIRQAAEAPLDPEQGQGSPPTLSSEEAERLYRGLMGELRRQFRNANGKSDDVD